MCFCCGEIARFYKIKQQKGYMKPEALIPGGKNLNNGHYTYSAQPE